MIRPSSTFWAGVAVFVIVPALWVGFLGAVLYWAIRIARLAWGVA